MGRAIIVDERPIPPLLFEVRLMTIRQRFELEVSGVSTASPVPYLLLETTDPIEGCPDVADPAFYFSHAAAFPLEASSGICCRFYALLFVIDGNGVHLLPVRAGACGDNGERFPITGYYVEPALDYFSCV
jgi:hypothetical protein